MLKKLVLIGVILAVAACAAARVTVYSRQQFYGEKMVQLNAPREAAWLPQVKAALADNGISIVPRGQFAPIELSVRGEVKAYCRGGGFDFANFKADIIDNSNGETLVTYRTKGYSENCPPVNGRIFEELGFLVNQMWR